MKALVLLSCLLCLAFAANYDVEEDVVVLNSKNFDEFVKGEALTLVEFYAPWCGHCKHLAPEYAKAASVLKKREPPIKIAKVDATVEEELGSRFNVRGYPTLKIFKNGEPTEYSGPREAAGIVAYLEKRAGKASTHLKTAEQAEAFFQSHENDPVIVYFGSLESGQFAKHEQVSEKLREQFFFAHSDSDEVLTKYGKKDSLVVYPARKYTTSKLEVSEHVYDGTSDLESFVKTRVLPLAGDYTEDNANLYKQVGLPLVKVYAKVDWAKNAKGANYHLNRIRKVAQEFVGKLSFAIASKEANLREVNDLNLDSIENPMAIFDLSQGLRYRSTELFSVENLKRFATDYLAGSLEAHIKSEPIPEQKDDVTVVVAKNFNDIVLDETKDVLLEAYAPWCGHCKSLEPKYRSLAKKLKPFRDTLVIAKIDATANDLPPQYSVEGFPTIFFAPANNKQNPIQFQGNREVKDFIKFIKQNAHFPLDKSKLKAKDEL